MTKLDSDAENVPGVKEYVMSTPLTTDGHILPPKYAVWKLSAREEFNSMFMYVRLFLDFEHLRIAFKTGDGKKLQNFFKVRHQVHIKNFLSNPMNLFAYKSAVNVSKRILEEMKPVMMDLFTENGKMFLERPAKFVGNNGDDLGDLDDIMKVTSEMQKVSSDRQMRDGLYLVFGKPVDFKYVKPQPRPNPRPKPTLYR